MLCYPVQHSFKNWDVPSGVLLLPKLPLLFILVASYEGVVLFTEERRKLRLRDRFFCLSIVYVCFYLLIMNQIEPQAGLPPKFPLSPQLPLVTRSPLPSQVGEESDRLKGGRVASQEDRSLTQCWVETAGEVITPHVTLAKRPRSNEVITPGDTVPNKPSSTASAKPSPEMPHVSAKPGVLCQLPSYAEPVQMYSGFFFFLVGYQTALGRLAFQADPFCFLSQHHGTHRHACHESPSLLPAQLL